MKPAPAVHFKHGYRFEQITRRGMVAIYEQQDGGVTVAYEVVILRNVKPSTFAGKTLPAREKIPTDKDWGQYGWTYSTYGGAVSLDAALAQAESKLTEEAARLEAKAT